MSKKRTQIPKKVRFEVFKRDKFTCQYCGCQAPDVVLHVDHIHPIASGGDADIVNLITSCVDCNLGKGARALSDDSVVVKQRAQLSMLQERREQIEMMAEWRRALADLEEQEINAVVDAMVAECPTLRPSESGARTIRKWCKRYSLGELIEAVEISFQQYLRHDTGDADLRASWEHAFNMVPRIIAVKRRGSSGEQERRLYYIRGILRNRLAYINERECMILLRDAVDVGIPVGDLESVAKKAMSWTEFREEIDCGISIWRDGK